MKNIPVVLITGAAQGIGAGCARVFHQAGWNVIIVDIDRERGEELSERFNGDRPESAVFLFCDVAALDSLQALVGDCEQWFGRLDCLVNNAGIHPPATPTVEMSLAEVERVLRVNFLSTFAGCQAAIPLLCKTHGTIVNISSMTAVLGQHQSVAYSASKGAQVSLTKSLAIELGPLGVRVNAVLPSNIDTPLMHSWANSLPDPASALDRVAQLQVLGRMGTADEIGHIAFFLASPASSFITGQAIEAEGGASLDY